MALRPFIVTALLFLMAESGHEMEMKPDVTDHNKKDEQMTESYDFYKYNSLENIESFLKLLTEKNKNISRLRVIGYTFEERPFYVVEISSRSFPQRKRQQIRKKTILMDCGTHAREWPTIAFCVYFINQLITSYKGNDTDIRKVLTKYDFLIIPVYNPDGYVYSKTKDRNWRKNRSKNENCYGVDLNRNFGTDSEGANPCSILYVGKKPFSELETISFIRLLKRNSRRLKAYFSIHTYGQYWMMPWAKKSEAPPKRYEEMARVGKIGAEAIRKRFGKVFEVGSASSLLYSANGTALDYVYVNGSVDYSFTLELRNKDKLQLPLKEIKPLCLETTDGVVAAILAMK